MNNAKMLKKLSSLKLNMSEKPISNSSMSWLISSKIPSNVIRFSKLSSAKSAQLTAQLTISAKTSNRRSIKSKISMPAAVAVISHLN